MIHHKIWWWVIIKFMTVNVPTDCSWKIRTIKLTRCHCVWNLCRQLIFVSILIAHFRIWSHHSPGMTKGNLKNYKSLCLMSCPQLKPNRSQKCIATPICFTLPRVFCNIPLSFPQIKSFQNTGLIVCHFAVWPD